MTQVLKVTIAKVSKKTTNGNFLTTLKTAEGKRTILGVEEDIQRTFLIAMRAEVKVGESHDLDLSLFDIAVRPFKSTMPGSEGQIINMKWLIRKAVV